MKFDRVLGILVSLLAREKTTAQGLADRYDVSVRTIFRDLRSLEEAGIPVVSAPGPGGGVGLMEGFSLDRHLLRPEELDRLRGAMAGLSRVFPDEAVRAGQRKLEGLAQGRSGPELVYLDLDAWSSGDHSPGLTRLADACRHDRVCQVAYKDGDGVTSHREVEPLTLVWRGSRWYLFAWCRWRNDYRLFRASSLIEVRPTGERASRRPGTYASTLKAAEKEAPRVTVTVRFSAAKAHLAPPTPRFDETGRATVEVTLGPEEVFEFCARWGPDLEVLAPEALRAEFRNRARRLYEVYFPSVSEKP